MTVIQWPGADVLSDNDDPSINDTSLDDYLPTAASESDAAAPWKPCVQCAQAAEAWNARLTQHQEAQAVREEEVAARHKQEVVWLREALAREETAVAAVEATLSRTTQQLLLEEARASAACRRSEEEARKAVEELLETEKQKEQLASALQQARRAAATAEKHRRDLSRSSGSLEANRLRIDLHKLTRELTEERQKRSEEALATRQLRAENNARAKEVEELTSQLRMSELLQACSPAALSTESPAALTSNSLRAGQPQSGLRSVPASWQSEEQDEALRLASVVAGEERREADAAGLRPQNPGAQGESTAGHQAPLLNEASSRLMQAIERAKARAEQRKLLSGAAHMVQERARALGDLLSAGLHEADER
eukprot:TRINITY_DN27964_c0_g1_i2.p1 TRINITY_DN27964_c0_g1~~TRINITY_DN27964_c0_g1_i2.p1  ORF type:complete len:367 (-),score=83.59 TRINITY_DN27964_c0_g1_i2:824-1924(-)